MMIKGKQVALVGRVVVVVEFAQNPVESIQCSGFCHLLITLSGA